MYETILYSVNEGVATITINNPGSMNAINDLIIDELVQAFTAARDDAEVKVVVLNGAGKAFCAGGDLSTFKQGLEDGTLDMRKNMQRSSQLPIVMKKMPKPIIASVHGPAAGAGCSLALLADYCIATDTAKFIEAFIGIGLIPDTGGVYALSKSVGTARAAQLAMTGEPVDAQKAYEYGMVYKVVTEEELEAETMKLAKRLSKGPSNCYKAIKEIIWKMEWNDFPTYLKLEEDLQDDCAKADNFKEGVNAFLEKRRPSYN